MDQSELLSIIESEEANCLSTTSGALAEQRRAALQYYHGLPYGNEIEGRSQVVTTEVKDAIEAILPSLMAIFTSTDEIVRFEPQNPDDEEAAAQATDYINYIFTRQNPGFTVLYCLFKDALLLKNGYAKVYWDEYTETGKESYEDLSDDQFQSLMMDDGLELIEHSERVDEVAAQEMAAQFAIAAEQGVQLPPMPVPKLHNATFRKNRKIGKVCVDPAPPEEILISRDARNNLGEARFVEHRTKKTISQIREMGYDVPDDIADFSTQDYSEERQERLRYDDAQAYMEDSGTSDPSTREVWLCEAYLHVDYDGDGIAEFRKVTKVGKTILDNEEFDSLPIIGGTAILMPHKHYGLSIYDVIGEIQLQSSTLLRNIFDNTYNANNGRYAVLDGMVNMDDLLTNRPGGVVRMKAMNAVQRLETPILGQPAYNLLEYLQKIKQNRVGVTDFPNAVDPDALNAKAHTAEIFRNAAMERVHLMARILAEGPVKDLFWKILELVSKHQNKPQVVKLRGRWVEVDPREWKNKFNLTVTVGLGTGSQATMVNGALKILEVQAGMMSSGLGGVVVTEENMYQAGKLLAKGIFPKHADVLFQDPKLAPPKEPPPPDPKIIAAQIQAQTQLQIQQMKDQQEQMTQALKKQFDAEKTQFREMMAQLAQDKQIQVDVAKHESQQSSDIHKTMMEIFADRQAAVVDHMAKSKLQAEQAAEERVSASLQGLIDKMLEMEKGRQERDKALVEAMLAPKEIVRDEKGKAKGVKTSGR